MRILGAIAVAALTAGSLGTQAMGQSIKPSTNYDEAFRGQFHFSPSVGWMNDVNGLWFDGHLYHMTFQYYPFGLTWGPMHWGHATSSDMMHWTQQAVALDPGVNVPGDCWSGSTVVDAGNTSGLATGSNPVLVSIYTATNKGTCLAYSNDLGSTWQGYEGNPVDIGGPNGDTRDPHVFWYPSPPVPRSGESANGHWVCAYYEKGTSIYTSPDLKHWTKTCHLDFGFECPDMYELAVDGEVNHRKWVLQDGAGDYLLGSFDGIVFTPDAGGPYRMNVGPDFYAAQTFFRGTPLLQPISRLEKGEQEQSHPNPLLGKEREPERSRVIQLAWNSRPGNPPPNTHPWTHDATFPCELRLRSFAEGIRLTRTPIDEIAKLYENARHYGPQVVTAGQNLFEGRHSETCDVEVVIDTTRSTASAVTFRLANLGFAYDLKRQTLFDQPLAPIDGQVKIRILRDWGQIEVFRNDGELSYSQQFQFTPGDGDLSMTADDGNVAIESADFHDVRRTWPGKARKAPVMVDDADPSVVYLGTWHTDNNPFYYGATCHYGDTPGGSFETTFRGKSIEWWGLMNVDLGKADVYVDGMPAAQDIDCYSAVRSRALLFEKSGLKSGEHTIRVVVTGKKNAASTGASVVTDCFVVRE